MSCSSVHRLIFAGLLCLTLAIKVSGAVETRGPNADDIIRAQLHGFLRTNGFDDTKLVEIFNPVAVSGQDGSCRLLILNAAPQGWHRDMLARYATGSDRSFFVFQGKIYQRQPVWRTTLDHYWAMSAHGVGLNVPNRLVLGVVASPGCDAERLPWVKVAEAQAEY
jgi:hypothetical protein